MVSHSDYALSSSDATLLDMLAGDNFPAIRALPLAEPLGKTSEIRKPPSDPIPTPQVPQDKHGHKSRAFARRDAALDPLLLAAVFASGADMTRNHYSHDFFPGVQLPTAESSYDWRKFTGVDASKVKKTDGVKKFRYVSRQMPRRERLQQQGIVDEGASSGKENADVVPLASADNVSLPKPRRASLVKPEHADTDVLDKPTHLPSVPSKTQKPVRHTPKGETHAALSSDVVVAAQSAQAPELAVKCMARTRIPTPYGPVFLHLYHNNRDNKEHLAVVVDGAQQEEHEGSDLTPIRSRTLDASWGPDETEMDRVIRGAYVGKLGPGKVKASTPPPPKGTASSQPRRRNRNPPPLIRIHSECFTGETIGSMRCDCGEQLAEALRLISHSQTKQGVVVYLRQEGRGIGLLNKIKAYNLQDMGADTVKANELLGFKADERGYEVVGGILRDLGLAPDVDEEEEKGVRLLTNNPDKVAALEKEGVKVIERVAMVPRSWQVHVSSLELHTASEEELSLPSHVYGHGHGLAGILSTKGSFHHLPAAGGILGASAPYGADLDKYLRTKVEKMGHILPKVWEVEQGL